MEIGQEILLETGDRSPALGADRDEGRLAVGLQRLLDQVRVEGAAESLVGRDEDHQFLALAAILAWAEIPYRIARRVDNEPATLTALVSHIHGLQQDIGYHSQWLFIDSPDSHAAYSALVTATKGQAATFIHDAWRRDPAATPERQIIGASYAVDVSQECDAFRDAVLLHLNTAGYHRRWRRPKSSRSSRRDITRR